MARGRHSITMTLLVVALPFILGASDPMFPAPANPFAKPGDAAPGGGGLPEPLSVPSSAEGDGLLPGSDAAAAAPLDEPGSAIQPPLPGGEPPSAPAPSADPDVLPSSMGGAPPSSRPAVHASGGSLFRLKPTLCLGAIAAACVMTRPAEAALVTALDAHHEQWQHVLDPALRSEPVELLEIGLGRLSMHSELIWLGVLGQWLPVLPSSMGGLNHFIASAGAPSLLVLSLTFFYLVRKLIGSSQLSVSFEGLLQKGKLHTLLTSSFSPVGLAHWAHALAVIILVAPGLEEHYGRKALIGLYAAAGAASAFACVLTQMLFGKRAQPRSSVSGASLGLLLLHAATEVPPPPLEIGGMITLKPLRAVLLHVILDSFSNGLPRQFGRSIGIEKLISLLGAGLLIGTLQPPLREGVCGAFEECSAAAESGSFGGVLEYIKSAL